MIIILFSCSLVYTTVMIYFYYTNKNKFSIIELNNNTLPQTYGCVHKKEKNTYFFQDKIYCELCWYKINNNILYCNNHLISITKINEQWFKNDDLNSIEEYDINSKDYEDGFIYIYEKKEQK